MQIVKWLLMALVAGGVALVLAGQAGLFKGTPPEDLGVRNGRLKAPSATDNSVSSQAALYPGHSQQQSAQIAALALQGDGPATIARLKSIVEASPGSEVVTTEADYLYARFTSGLLKFVDDVEFWYDPNAQLIQVRSASRVGRGDLGANRKRIESIRAALARPPT